MKTKAIIATTLLLCTVNLAQAATLTYSFPWSGTWDVTGPGSVSITYSITNVNIPAGTWLQTADQWTAWYITDTGAWGPLQTASLFGRFGVTGPLGGGGNNFQTSASVTQQLLLPSNAVTLRIGFVDFQRASGTATTANILTSLCCYDDTFVIEGPVAVPGTVLATPLPAALPLFAAGLGGIFGLLGWHRKRGGHRVLSKISTPAMPRLFGDGHVTVSVTVPAPSA